MTTAIRPIAIYYEHPEWFRPLFVELERRDLPYTLLDAARHTYDPAAHPGFSLFVNRMSPSAHNRGHGNAIFHTLSYLAHLERLGVRVVNGARAYQLETSKALQISLLHSLGLPYPRARVINDASQTLAASEGLRFPVVVKPNVGGSGFGIVRFDTPAALARAVDENKIELGIDHTALVQEFIPARGGHIVRVEVLGGRFLYAIRVFLAGASFNLCPADICIEGSRAQQADAACPAKVVNAGIRVHAYTPPAEVIHAVERIMQAAGIEVGGIEYIVDDRDGQLLFYDINALSNFVAEADRVLGFNPYGCLADYLGQEARKQVTSLEAVLKAAAAAGERHRHPDHRRWAAGEGRLA